MKLTNYAATLITASVLAACGQPPTVKAPEQIAAEKAEDEKAAALWANHKEVTYKGNPYFVAFPNRQMALVQAAKSGFSYTPRDVTQIAQRESGCAGEFQAGVLAYMGGFNDASDLTIAKGKDGKPLRWRVDLSC